MDAGKLWTTFISKFMSAVNTLGFADLLDWLVVAFLIYHAVRLVRETRAMQLVKGIAAILLAYFFASWLRMNTLSFVLQNIVGSGVLLLVVLFQPELRRALEHMGRSKLTGISFFGVSTAESRREHYEGLIRTLVEGCARLSASKTGALIVIERETMLGEIVKTGTVIDSYPSFELVENIFFKNSPLHDGALIIRDNRLYAAGCYLPLSTNMEIGRELGTRHRAALGMSEVSDAIVVIVSEETGAISIANESQLNRGFSPEKLGELLQAELIGEESDKAAPKLRIFRRTKK